MPFANCFVSCLRPHTDSLWTLKELAAPLLRFWATSLTELYRAANARHKWVRHTTQRMMVGVWGSTPPAFSNFATTIYINGPSNTTGAMSCMPHDPVDAWGIEFA